MKTRHHASILLLAALLAGPAVGIEIASVPLFVSGNLAPNVVLTLDDSGSMQRGYVAELCGNDDSCPLLDNRWTKSAHGNPLYYNPAVRYAAPPRADRSALSTDFGKAWRDGFTPATGAVDLGNSYRPSAALNRFMELECPPLDGGDSYSGYDCYMGHYVGNTVAYQQLAMKQTGGGGAPYLDLPDFRTRHGPATANLFLVKVNGDLFNKDPQELDGDECRESNSPKGRFYRTRYIGDTLRLCFNKAYRGLKVEARMHGPARAPGEPGSAVAPVPAYYYVYNDRLAGCADRVAQKRNNACYEFVQVGAGERQNFANWYSFYRNRNLATVSAAAIAFSGVSASTRVAWQALNSCRNSTSVLVTPTCKANLQDATGFGSNAIGEIGDSTHRNNFYGWLFKLPTAGNTPLREALRRAGEYFKDTTSSSSPYHNVPGNAGSGQYSCRRNFHIMMTDGIWNDDDPKPAGNDDYDPIHGLYDYRSGQPYAHIFSDVTPNTLSDLAFRYWVNDLAPTLDNRVQATTVDEDADRNGVRDSDAQLFWNARNNPATWQHMVNFTIGLGLSDYLAAAGLIWSGDMYGGSYDAIMAGLLPWPPAVQSMGQGFLADDSINPDYGKSAHDLWHAAINSRGRFFSAESPDMLNDAFASALAQVEAATPTAAALASNSTKTGDGTRVYQARFDTRSWSGHLYALQVDARGNIDASHPVWDAATAMPAPAQRSIFVRSGSAGVEFAWERLNEAQKAALDQSDGNGRLRLNWLRGDHGAEQQAGGPLRSRLAFDRNYDGNSVTLQRAWTLGDIVSSDPRYVGAGSQGYDQLPPGAAGRSSYAAFTRYKERRAAAIYVGANDGMLHAFRASDGVELSAFIPAAVFDQLYWLTRPLYAHRHYVDGSPGSGDAYLVNSLSHASGWNTVVVSGLRGGGKSVFAIDATSADSPSAQQFMWEFTDAEMGYSYSQPQVARLNDGSWAAVFGNGYESGAGSLLYIVDLNSGELIRKLGASAGVNGRDGGLSTPVLVDENNDQIADSAYAGDLQGRLWKFDLSGSRSAQWQVANGGLPLFSARSRSGNPQPITVQPTVAREQAKGGFWVFFGTGRMLSGNDIAGSAMTAFEQSLYGLWDSGSAIELPAGGRRADLLVEQSVAPPEGVSKNGMQLRLTTDNPVDLGQSVRGWYMDLPTGGERVIAEALTVIDNATASRNRVVFVTAIPSSDPCSAKGSGWLMELHFNGRRPWSPVFDLNNDELFKTGDDTITGTTGTGGTEQTVSGIKSEVGIPDTVTWLDIDKDKAMKHMPGTSGGVQPIRNRGRGDVPIRRRHWQQLM